MKFIFGDIKSNESKSTVNIEAHNLQHAIKIFKVSELFPEQYVNRTFIARKENGYFDQNYNSDLRRNETRFKPGAKIYVYEDRGNEKRPKKVHELTLEECINVDFRSILPQQNLLEAPFSTRESESKELLPVIESSQAVTQIHSKQDLRNKHDEILLKRAELDAMIRNLNQSMNVLQKEIEQKAKIVYVIETFLGIHEQVVQINKGLPVSEEEPLTLFQQRLYMDEEVGLWGEYEDKAQGLDFTQIEEFDKWIAKEYKRYLYAPKSVCVFRVRRRDKEYGNVWANIYCNAENTRTYFLFRNGENLYRIWSDVSVGPRLFPTMHEYAGVLKEYENWGEDRQREKLKDKHESYLYGLIAIQGIIERTDLLGTSLRSTVNLFRPDGIPKDRVRFIRDDEPEFWLGDGKPRWKEFAEKNRSTIMVGTRVVLAVRPWYFHLNAQKDSDDWRCSPFRPSHPPSRSEIYIIEEETKGGYHSANFKFLYNPGDEIWRRDSFTSSPRKKRVPWLTYRGEILNFDAITLEDAEHYEQSRLDRADYLDILPTIHWIKKIRKEERALELEFTKFIAGQLSWDESRYGEIREAIDWWKLKNKWKRAVTINEALAVRMILKKLGKE